MQTHLSELPLDLLRAVEAAVSCALAEDVGQGDVTSLWTIPAQVQAEGRFRCKAEGILAGLTAGTQTCQRRLTSSFWRKPGSPSTMVLHLARGEKVSCA